jgi:WXG100 family type VII secretion target
MGRKVQLNYDELRTVVKKFRDEGEDIVQMHSTMRDRVHDLHKDWVGEGADKFIREMENDLLPALSRLASALFYAQDVLHKIIKTIQIFDEDTSGYFKGDFDQVNPINLGAFVAGAGVGAGVGSMVDGSLSGGLSGAGSGVGGASGGGLSGVGSGDPISGTGEPFTDSPADSSGQTGGVDETPGAGGQSPGAGAGGGAGGGSSSQGLQGNLQGMGGGVGAQVGGGAGGGSIGGGSNAPDHIYDGSQGMGAGGSSSQTSQGSGSAGGGAQGTAGGGASVAAGAAGVAGGAAIGGAAKSIKGRVRKKKK